jgi:hypothetical protein
VITGGATVSYGMGPNLPPPEPPRLEPNCTPITIHDEQVTVSWTTRNIPIGSYTRMEVALSANGPWNNIIGLNQDSFGEPVKVWEYTINRGLGLDPATQYFWRVVEYDAEDVFVGASTVCSFTTLAADDARYLTCSVPAQVASNYIVGGGIAAQIGTGAMGTPFGNYSQLTEIATDPAGPWQTALDMETQDINGPYRDNPLLAPNGDNVDQYTLPGGLTPDTDYYLRISYKWIVGDPDPTIQELICGPFRTLP